MTPTGMLKRVGGCAVDLHIIAREIFGSRDRLPCMRPLFPMQFCNTFAATRFHSGLPISHALHLYSFCVIISSDVVRFVAAGTMIIGVGFLHGSGRCFDGHDGVLVLSISPAYVEWGSGCIRRS